MNFSKKQIFSLIIIALLIAAVPPTIYLLQQRQIIKSQALEPVAQCIPEDGSYGSEGYSYTPGALEIYVSVVETNGAIGPIPGVYLRADKIDNNPGTGANTPINFSDGAGCGFSAEGITDSSGHVNLEPLNCAHNNFKVSHGNHSSGLPPDVEFDSLATTFQPDGNNQSNTYTPDISNLPLDNGYAGILKLYYKRKPSIEPTPTPTPACFVGKACSECGGNFGICQPDCSGGWCNGGKCESCSPAIVSTPTPSPSSNPTPSPTPSIECPVPDSVANIRISCPYCQ